MGYPFDEDETNFNELRDQILKDQIQEIYDQKARLVYLRFDMLDLERCDYHFGTSMGEESLLIKCRQKRITERLWIEIEANSAADQATSDLMGMILRKSGKDQANFIIKLEKEFHNLQSISQDEGTFRVLFPTLIKEIRLLTNSKFNELRRSSIS